MNDFLDYMCFCCFALVAIGTILGGLVLIYEKIMDSFPKLREKLIEFFNQPDEEE